MRFSSTLRAKFDEVEVIFYMGQYSGKRNEFLASVQRLWIKAYGVNKQVNPFFRREFFSLLNKFIQINV